MKQAKVLTEAETNRVCAVIAASKHSARNRIAVMLSFYAGLRVGEISALKYGDVFDADGNAREQIMLKAAYTKGNHARTVFVGKRLDKELKTFKLSLSSQSSPSAPLLLTQKNTAFSANTLCQLFGQLYRKAAVDGASSHSGRRGFITKLAHSGISAKVIMTLAGHKHLSTTQRYIDVNDEMLKAAVEVV
jgi:integrase/recombinase XerD